MKIFHPKLRSQEINLENSLDIHALHHIGEFYFILFVCAELNTLDSNSLKW